MRTLQLNHEGFENYLVQHFYRDNGVHYKFRFENRRGASVVKHDYSYGSRTDKWELAVLWWHDENDFSLDYGTEITDDVIGYLNDDEVRDLLRRIKEL